MLVNRFDNLAAATSRAEERILHMVAAIHVPTRVLPHEPCLPMGLQWPAKAFNCNSSLNMTTLQRRIVKGELPETALVRAVKEEYGLGLKAVHRISYLTSTLIPISPHKSKEGDFDHQYLHWHLLYTDREICLNPEKVEKFSWCCGPEEVFDCLLGTRPEKVLAISAAVSAAVGHGLPDMYRSLASLKRCDHVAA